MTRHDRLPEEFQNFRTYCNSSVFHLVVKGVGAHSCKTITQHFSVICCCLQSRWIVDGRDTPPFHMPTVLVGRQHQLSNFFGRFWAKGKCSKGGAHGPLVVGWQGIYGRICLGQFQGNDVLHRNMFSMMFFSRNCNIFWKHISWHNFDIRNN